MITNSTRFISSLLLLQWKPFSSLHTGVPLLLTQNSNFPSSRNFKQRIKLSSFSLSIRAFGSKSKSHLSFSLSSKPFSVKNESCSGSEIRVSSSSLSRHPFGAKTKTNLSISFSSKPNMIKPCKATNNEQEDSEISSSPPSVTAVVEKPSEIEETQKTEMSEDDTVEAPERENQEELDWKTDDEFKKFMGNPSIEAAIKLEKKRADRKLRELDRESSSSNPLVGFLNKVVRDNLAKEKERLEKAEESFKALDLNKLKSCFGFDTFFCDRC